MFFCIGVQRRPIKLEKSENTENNGVDGMDLLRKDFFEKFKIVKTLQENIDLKVEFLGKKGILTGKFKILQGLSGEEKKNYGLAINHFKEEIVSVLHVQKEALEAKILQKDLQNQWVDLSLPHFSRGEGVLHPIEQVIGEVVSIFHSMGFCLFHGPDIESDYYNFTALNIPQGHPARQMQDTFYMDHPQEYVLRTHTSPVQIRYMQENSPPLRVIAPGRTYRCDYDVTHTPMFHQAEGLVVDQNIHMGHLKGCLKNFLKIYFEVDDLDIRFRPSYFPFTEPSAEVDLRCSFRSGQLVLGEGDDWMEILGCGMVHPRVLEAGRVDPLKYQGFAFGMGMERIAMLKYGISDLRSFFESDLRWLRHYGFSALRTLDMSQGAMG